MCKLTYEIYISSILTSQGHAKVVYLLRSSPYVGAHPKFSAELIFRHYPHLQVVWLRQGFDVVFITFLQIFCTCIVLIQFKKVKFLTFIHSLPGCQTQNTSKLSLPLSFTFSAIRRPSNWSRVVFPNLKKILNNEVVTLVHCTCYLNDEQDWTLSGVFSVGTWKYKTRGKSLIGGAQSMHILPKDSDRKYDSNPSQLAWSDYQQLILSSKCWTFTNRTKILYYRPNKNIFLEKFYLVHF